jgi:hypothetical protein
VCLDPFATDPLHIVFEMNRIADWVVGLWLLDFIRHVALASLKSPVRPHAVDSPEGCLSD